jgi:hypothetical protein
MPTRGNPLSITVLGQLDPRGLDDQVKKITRRIYRDDNARMDWLESTRVIDKQLKGTTERRNPPWKGACDLAPPLTKKLLRRWIPVVFNLVALADPISHFYSTEPRAADAAPVAEEFFTWLIRVHMDNVMTEFAYLANGVGSKGQDYVAVSWDYRTELETRVVISENLWPNGPPDDINVILQTLMAEYDIKDNRPEVAQQLQAAAQAIANNAPFVRLEFRRVVKDKPKIQWWPSGRVIVPPRSADPEDADYVCLVHDLTAAQLRQMAFDGTLNGEAVDAVVTRNEKPANTAADHEATVPRQGHTNNDTIEREQLFEAGVNDIHNDGTIRIHQVYCKLDKNMDGIDERVIFWYAPRSEGGDILAMHDFPFSFKYWPVFRFDYEKTDRRPHTAQGIGQQTKAIQDQYTKQYRATSDAIDIQLAPVFQFRCTSKLQARSVKWGPGKIIPVSQVGDLAPVEKAAFNLDKYIQNRGELKAFAEEMVGSIDAALQATGSKLERRSATEVQAVSGQIEAMQGMDAAIWQLAAAKVFQCVWDLWLDFGQEAIYFAVMGQRAPKLFRKSEHSYHYQLIPAGTPGNTNRQAELKRILEVAQIMFQFAPDIMNREFVMSRIAKLLDPKNHAAIILPEAQRRANQVIQDVANAVAQGNIPNAALAFMGQEPEQGAAPADAGL